MVFAQHHYVDEESALFVPQRIHFLHRDRDTCPTVLGGRDLRELHLLHQHQQCIPDNQANGAHLSVSPLFGLYLKALTYASDPWWVFTTCHLFYIIRRQYSLQIFELVTVSPRFGILLVSMCLSLAFTVLDACSVVGALPLSLPKGAGPFWRVSFVFTIPMVQINTNIDT